MDMLRTAVLIYLTSFLCAWAANAATLNKDITLHKDVLTVGDVFAEAGAQKDHVLGPAPKPGNVMVLNAKTLAHISKSFNVGWTASTGLETVSIRSGHKQPAKPVASDAVVKVPVLAEPARKDDVIKASDLTWIELPAKDLREDTALKLPDVVGKAARSLVQANVPISTNLLVSPKMIKRGDLVTLTLNTGRILLTAKGRAMEDARMGDMVRIQNAESQKIVQARVTGPQEAIIEPTS